VETFLVWGENGDFLYGKVCLGPIFAYVKVL